MTHANNTHTVMHTHAHASILEYLKALRFGHGLRIIEKYSLKEKSIITLELSIFLTSYIVSSSTSLFLPQLHKHLQWNITIVVVME